MSDTQINKIHAREILDSRGNPTVEVDVTLNDGSFGRAAVPSGASTGEHEAVELRDGGHRYLGKGTQQAVNNVNNIISQDLMGKDALDQKSIDDHMIALDGTDNKSNLGANAILGVSMAVAKAAANYKGVSLFRSIGNENCSTLPIPMMNILNGGSHADNSVDIQEFMVFPIGADSFSHALKMGTEIFHHLKSVLKGKGLNTAVGDEGGFAPDLNSNEEAIEVIIEATGNAGYNIGKDVYLALDVAASELFSNGAYNLASEERTLTSDEMISYYSDLINKYPIVSIEDGLDENDWDGWIAMNKAIGDKVQIVGDDLTVTNIDRLQTAIDKKAMNAILVKLNQIGTVSETIDAVSLAKENGYGTIISHRSGETEDATIADLAVALNAGQIKTGSASRTDRVCKYNQLLRIEEELGESPQFSGIEVLGR